MSSLSQYDQLFEEFPELQLEDVILQKEIFLHFGMLFSGYALLETAVQNCYIFWRLHASLKENNILSQKDWQERQRSLEEQAFSSTFGTLLKLVPSCPELSIHMSELRVLKKKRDFFAHHFFREENEKLFSDISSLHLIYRMNVLRNEVKVMDSSIDKVAMTLLEKIYPKIDLEEKVTLEVDKIEADAKKNPRMTFGWEESD